MVRVRVFRAVDDPESSERFIEGHAKVLDSIGVKKVTSSNNDWAKNPAVWAVLVESPDGTKAYGGSRLHAVGGSQPLPIEEATGYMDEGIYELVAQYGKYGTGEICGLWNTREAAVMGIGSIFLTRAAVAIAEPVGLTSLFALCAPYTVEMAAAVGYVRDTTVGNEGTFYYPKLDLLATVMILKDVAELSKADEKERSSIMALREQPTAFKREVLRKKEIEIQYDLQVTVKS